MEENLYKNLLNENYTDVRKNALIQKVFENKTKSILSDKLPAFKFAEGGEVKLTDKEAPQHTYTPYEFLYILLPEVYGRPYVVSDKVGEEYDEQIAKDEKELEDYVNSKLAEYGVNSIYKIDNKSLIEEIEIRRRKIISDKSFITESELHAYLFSHPELNYEHYVKEVPVYDVPSLVAQGLLMIDYDYETVSNKYVYVYEYLSGDVYKKLTRLRDYKDFLMKLNVLNEQQFIKQEKALKKSYPKQAKITKDIDTCIFIFPSSDFGSSFRINPNDLMDLPIYSSESFINVFREWTIKEMDKAILIETNDILRVHHYFTDLNAKGQRPYNYESDVEYSDWREKAFNDGKVALYEFLNKALTMNCQLRLEHEWNEKHNNYAEPKYYKIPVSCQLSNKFKENKPFIPNETQIQSMQFMKSIGSGLLAYGVGVGKTASAILNVSYSLDNNLCKKPLIIVPSATYRKWEMEMFGGMEEIYAVTYTNNGIASESTFKEENKAKKFAKAVDGELSIRQVQIYGHLDHRNNYVGLKNLGSEIVSNYKDYTDEDLNYMSNIGELLNYVKRLPNDYNFDDDEINNYILEKKPSFILGDFNENYNFIVRAEFDKWYLKDSNVILIRQAIGENYVYVDNAFEYYKQNITKIKKVDIFRKELNTLRAELPYTLGTIKNYEDGTIFLTTYEGLEHLGLLNSNNSFQKRANQSIFGKVYNELSQGDNISSANYGQANLPTQLSEAVYGRKNDMLDITAFGFDYVVFDESHIMKKAIVDCKGLPTGDLRGYMGIYNRETRKYGFGKTDKPSANALRGYFLTRYIQENNNQKNVVHLTATPFTNKPAEIFSMLSLVNKQLLQKNGFTYMQQFFDLYMDISFELAFTGKGVERVESLLGYRNLPQLRNLIYTMMDYKSGEDANIKRPEKILLPSVERGRETTIPETPQQDFLFRQIKDYIRGKINYNELCADSVSMADVDEMTEEDLLEYVNKNGTDAQKEKFAEKEIPLDEDSFYELKDIVKKISEREVNVAEIENNIRDDRDRDKFRVIQGYNLLRSVTLSPYLSTCQKEASIEPTYDQYVESSPKILYAIKCIVSIHNYELENNLRKSGCVMYMDLGVNVSYSYTDSNGNKVKFKWRESGFEKIRQYLINRYGYNENEVSIASGGVSPEQKEIAKNKFLSGQSSVLIGSRTISTGIDLQNNASALFLCAYDWNPTDNEQISGRIHRQGNRFEKIRIVYPMIMNSADPNIFQQLYEKTLRIKNIWDKNDTGNTLDLKDFDVDSLRKGIMDEAEDLASYWVQINTKEVQKKDNILKARLNSLRTIREDKEVLDRLTPVMRGIIVVLDAFKKDKAKKEGQAKLNEKLGDAKIKYDNKIAELKEKLDEDDDFADQYKVAVKEAKEKFEKAKEKLGEDVYDYDKDPEGRYTYLTYDELDEEQIVKKLSSLVTNYDSYFNNLEQTDKKYIWNGDVFNPPFEELKNEEGYRIGWLEKNFPRFHNGNWDLSVTEQEDNYQYIDFDSNKPRILVNQWKGAYRGWTKMVEYLKGLNIEFNDIPQAIDNINGQISQVQEDLEKILNQYQDKLQEFILAKEERLIIQKSLDERVDEFAEMNDILHEQVETFAEDRARFVVLPYEEREKPKRIEREIKQKIQKAVMVEEEQADEEEQAIQVDTTNLIANLRNGMVVRFTFGKVRKNRIKVIDIFFEEDEYIKYTALENEEGDIVNDEEETITEQQVIDFYVENYDKITEEFYDEEGVEEEEMPVVAPVLQEEIEEEEVDENVKTRSKAEMYRKLIEAYEIGLEIEEDEEKKKLYRDNIRAYEIGLELEE